MVIITPVHHPVHHTVAKPIKAIGKPFKFKPKSFKSVSMFKSSGFKTGALSADSPTIGKWSVKTHNVHVGEGGVCGSGELDYNVNNHVSTGVYGSGCIGNPFSSHPYPTTATGGGVVVRFHF